MALYSFDIGDYSDDGHGKHNTYYLEVSDEVTKADLAANYAKNVEEFGFALTDIASEYEDSRIDADNLLTLLKAGFVDEPLSEKDQRWDDDDYIIESDEDEIESYTYKQTQLSKDEWAARLTAIATEKPAEDEDDLFKEAVARRVEAKKLDLNGSLNLPPVVYSKQWKSPLDVDVKANEEKPEEPKDPWEDFDEFEDYFLTPTSMFRIAIFFFTHGLPENIVIKPLRFHPNALIGWNGAVDGFVGYGTLGS